MNQWKAISLHVHHAGYALIILLAVVLHGNHPITSTSSKLAIVLMSLLIFSESIGRILTHRNKTVRDARA